MCTRTLFRSTRSGLVTSRSRSCGAGNVLEHRSLNCSDQLQPGGTTAAVPAGPKPEQHSRLKLPFQGHMSPSMSAGGAGAPAGDQLQPRRAAGAVPGGTKRAGRAGPAGGGRAAAQPAGPLAAGQRAGKPFSTSPMCV